MGTENTETTTTETAPVETTETTQPKPTETVDYWKQRSRENESKARANADKAQQFDALTEAQKTVEQKAADATAAAEKRATEAETKALRLEVAADKGLTKEQAKRLVGSTLEELQADADDLIATFGKKPDDTDDDVTRTATSLDLGTRTTTKTTSGDPAQVFAKDLAARMRR